jgi:hypothetical protein
MVSDVDHPIGIAVHKLEKRSTSSDSSKQSFDIGHRVLHIKKTKSGKLLTHPHIF